MSDKIKPQHVAPKAMLYVRQSSAYQVNHNLESQRLQYAMQDRLHHVGWREIEAVDEDMGRSAAGTVMRTGVARMVAEVCLGNAGGVGGIPNRAAKTPERWTPPARVPLFPVDDGSDDVVAGPLGARFYRPLGREEPAIRPLYQRSLKAQQR